MSTAMSLDQHDLVDAEGVVGAPGAVTPAEAVAEGLASVRLEGLEPDRDGLCVLDQVAAGQLSISEALTRVLAAARVA